MIRARRKGMAQRGGAAKSYIFGMFLSVLMLLWWPAFPGLALNGKTYKEVVKDRTENFSQLGEWREAVALDPPSDWWFSRIDHAERDSKTGDLVVLDRSRPGRVCRYDSTGKLLLCYGFPNGQGPGEYLGLRDFALLEDGSVVVIGARKTMLFAADGTLKKEKLNGNLSPSQAVAQGNRYFLTHTGIIKTTSRRGIFPVTGDLQVGEGFHPFDERLRLLMFVPSQHFTLYKGRLYLGDWFDFKIYAYDTDGKRAALYDYGSSDLDFSGLKEGEWNQKLSSRLVQNISRATSVQAFNGGVFIYHMNNVVQSSAPGILKPEKGVLYLFPELGFLNQTGPPNAFKVDRVVGSYEEGLICSIVDEDRLARARPLLPALQAFPEEDDRAYLFFLKLNPEPGKRVH